MSPEKYFLLYENHGPFSIPRLCHQSTIMSSHVNAEEEQKTKDKENCLDGVKWSHPLWPKSLLVNCCAVETFMYFYIKYVFANSCRPQWEEVNVFLCVYRYKMFMNLWATLGKFCFRWKPDSHDKFWLVYQWWTWNFTKFCWLLKCLACVRTLVYVLLS